MTTSPKPRRDTEQQALDMIAGRTATAVGKPRGSGWTEMIGVGLWITALTMIAFVALVYFLRPA